ncbi:cellulose synthase (UDP-forming) [Calothrix sp. NIES-4071]|nr:cellulose synthase (UDP-forming) [Calothrix sp. NIES-4071]BAZ55291.1 cellulose synthase (UDP-forming) [Calothrix sp. NIES-4105]
MRITHDKKDSHRIESKHLFKFRTATLVILAIVALSAIIVLAWFNGEGTINRIFSQINAFEQKPPMWLAVPMVAVKYLLVPTVAVFIALLLVKKISPQPRVWSRWLVIGMLIFLTGRYLTWRIFTTLNVSTPLNGVFSLGLFFLEMIILISSTIQLFLMLSVKDRRQEASENSLAAIHNNFTPNVDILIPTYNEPVFILRRTIIGCQALDYTNKKIYLLDDTRRPEMKALAEELGCNYLTRADNLHAKAGNLNNAFTKINGEFIVVFDADFIPTKNFLTRTIGFFQDEKVALVQTPQTFYNADPIARNLGLENVITPEEEVFYRQIQPIKDGAGSVVCAGTSFVVRRSALEETGGFVTESLSEDYFTGIRLSAKGYKLIYLDEKLSAGLAAENISAHATQRLRWAQGTLQAFFIQSNPLTIRGLRPIQRLAHLEGLLHWFTSISRVGFLMMPLAYSFLNVIPIHATETETLYYFLPYFGANITVFSWLNSRSRSAILSEIYSLVFAFPLALTVIQVMLNPFSKGFNVTPKGTVNNKYYFNWSLALPLIVLFIATAVSFWRNLGMCLMKLSIGVSTPELVQHVEGLGLGWIWSAYNLILLAVSLLILIDAPKSDAYEWFDLRRVVCLTLDGKQVWGVTTIISEIGAEIALTQKPPMNLVVNQQVNLEILESDLQLEGIILSSRLINQFPILRIQFDSITLEQHRSLVEMLFCRPGQWKQYCTPNEFSSFLLLLRILSRPKIIFDRNLDASVVKVNKV